MTISIAWIRTVGRTQELLFASDSRYRSFGAWDCAPKLFELRGTGGVIGLSGDTEVTLAIVSQLQNCINMYAPFGDSAIDITHVIGHFLRLMNSMGNEIADKAGFKWYFSSVGLKAGFVVGGYSHQYNSFKMSHVLYKPSVNAFVKRPPIYRYVSASGDAIYTRSRKEAKRNGYSRLAGDSGVCVAGDYIEEFLEALSLKLKGKLALDMEPLEVLVQMLKGGKYEKIGGAPQIVKAYSYLSTLPIAVLWPKPSYIESPNGTSKSVFVFGRPLMHYERTTWPIIDADNVGTPIYPLQNVKPIFN